jgi:Arc/MetJ-type ribon-helix-helix transcriptional regulator
MTMAKRSSAPSDSKKIGVLFTTKQVDFIDRLVVSGELGGNRSEVIKQIILFHLKEKFKIEML